MKKSAFKKVTAAVISAAMLAAAAATANAAEIDKPSVKAVTVSQPTTTYEDYLEGKVEMDENSGVKIAPYASKGTVIEPSEALPSAYKSVCTPIRDQGSYNTCWAFSAMGAMESFLAKDGKGLKDLSEQHLSWWSTKQYNSNGIGWLQDGLDSGGYSMIGAGYLASWQGAKLESDLPYYTGGNQLPGNMDSVANSYNATGIVYVSSDINSVKQAVYQYGAVSTSFNSGGYYNDDLSAYYQPDETYLFSGHAITIVGWDDNYSRNNFDSSCRPSYDGAWLVKNSWGDDVGDDGYLWISYYDRYILDPNTWGISFAVTGARTATGFDRLYQNEEYGATYQTALYDYNSGEYMQEVTFANVFDFDSEHNKLQKVIFQTETMNADYDVYYIPVSNGKPVSDKSKWVSIGSGTSSSSGYISVDTGAYPLPSGKGAVAVTIKAQAGEYASIGVDEWLTDADGNFLFMPDQKRNESFVISGGDVYDLVDVYAVNEDDIGGTLVIKALATTNVVGDINLDGRITALDGQVVLRNAVGAYALSGEVLTNADANYDGRVTVADAMLVLRKAVAAISDF